MRGKHEAGLDAAGSPADGSGAPTVGALRGSLDGLRDPGGRWSARAASGTDVAAGAGAVVRRRVLRDVSVDVLRQSGRCGVVGVTAVRAAWGDRRIRAVVGPRGGAGTGSSGSRRRALPIHHRLRGVHTAVRRHGAQLGHGSGCRTGHLVDGHLAERLAVQRRGLCGHRHRHRTAQSISQACAGPVARRQGDGRPTHRTGTNRLGHARSARPDPHRDGDEGGAGATTDTHLTRQGRDRGPGGAAPGAHCPAPGARAGESTARGVPGHPAGGGA